MSHALFGRRMITTAATEITAQNILDILQTALSIHQQNRREIDYLWNYYKGKQPILQRVKQIRPEITNMIVENRANEIVSFKTGYLMGEPLQYVSNGDENINDKINILNSFVFAEEKASKDKELADWFHICGTSYRMILPDAEEEDESPFEIYTLDPRNTFVIYSSGLGNPPVLGVVCFTAEDEQEHYMCYSKYFCFEIVNMQIASVTPHILGDIPIIEYPLNSARIGAFEIVMPLLDAINLTDSNRLDGVEQFIQSLLMLRNIDLDNDQISNLHDYGVIKFRDIDSTMQGEVQYLTTALNQTETQTLVDHMYQTVLTICGMPSQNDGSSSDSSNNGAVIMRQGWYSAEARAKDTEMIFKKSERLFLKIVLRICEALSDLELKVSQIGIRFTRRNYENIQMKAQVLDMMLNNEKIHPKLAFENSGLFIDADLAYTLSEEYYQKRQEEQGLENRNADTGTSEKDSENYQSGQSSGSKD